MTMNPVLSNHQCTSRPGPVAHILISIHTIQCRKKDGPKQALCYVTPVQKSDGGCQCTTIVWWVKQYGAFTHTLPRNCMGWTGIFVACGTSWDGMGWDGLVTQCVNTSIEIHWVTAQPIPSYPRAACEWMHHYTIIYAASLQSQWLVHLFRKNSCSSCIISVGEWSHLEAWGPRTPVHWTAWAPHVHVAISHWSRVIVD